MFATNTICASRAGFPGETSCVLCVTRPGLGQDAASGETSATTSHGICLRLTQQSTPGSGPGAPASPSCESIRGPVNSNSRSGLHGCAHTRVRRRVCPALPRSTLHAFPSAAHRSTCGFSPEVTPTACRSLKIKVQFLSMVPEPRRGPASHPPSLLAPPLLWPRPSLTTPLSSPNFAAWRESPLCTEKSLLDWLPSVSENC